MQVRCVLRLNGVSGGAGVRVDVVGHVWADKSASCAAEFCAFLYVCCVSASLSCSFTQFFAPASL